MNEGQFSLHAHIYSPLHPLSPTYRLFCRPCPIFCVSSPCLRVPTWDRHDMEIRVRPPGPVLSPPPLLQAPTSNLPPPPIISSSPTAYSLMPLWSASSFPPISDVPSIVIVSNSVNAFAIQTFRNGSLSGRSIHVYHSHCRGGKLPITSHTSR
ncbi:hypothetical protein PISMIDRAFT_509874 [Pisolithus microcarpus 441]|uniref:Uncharacterized protein n=1 Tax=Pisolithus microcarpus 441 TaxID=765257 RepID=A0A0C9YBR9_9AGAM|nr:hypothetical protein PISMIDRAFT_509874 [Pisolithus microcarpus 441]